MKLLRRSPASTILLLILLFLLPLTLAGEDVLSVLYFENLDGTEEYGWMSKGIADTLISALSPVKEIELVEREELQKVLQEQKLTLSGLTASDDAARAGELLNAKYLVSGSYVVQSGRLLISSRITDTSSASIRGSFSSEIPLGDFSRLGVFLAREICGELGYSYPESGAGPGQELTLTALERYYRGIDRFDAGDFDSAVELFKDALRESPEYAAPQRSLENSYQFLKDFRKARQIREIRDLTEKVKDLRKRLEERPFKTYADVIMELSQAGASQSEIAALPQKRPELLQGNTPAQVIWHIQISLFELASKQEEYFSNAEAATAARQNILFLASRAQQNLPGDPFLPEILYQGLLSLAMEKRWKEVKQLSEELLISWPDFRMTWAIEDFYSQALDELSERE